MTAWSTPLIANYKGKKQVVTGGNLYLTSESGVITVIKLGEKFEIVATSASLILNLDEVITKQ